MGSSQARMMSYQRLEDVTPSVDTPSATTSPTSNPTVPTENASTRGAAQTVSEQSSQSGQSGLCKHGEDKSDGKNETDGVQNAVGRSGARSLATSRCHVALRVRPIQVQVRGHAPEAPIRSAPVSVATVRDRVMCWYLKLKTERHFLSMAYLMGRHARIEVDESDPSTILPAGSQVLLDDSKDQKTHGATCMLLIDKDTQTTYPIPPNMPQPELVPASAVKPYPTDVYDAETKRLRKAIQLSRACLFKALQEWMLVMDLQLAALKPGSMVWVPRQDPKPDRDGRCLILQRLRLVQIKQQFPGGILYHEKSANEYTTWSACPSMVLDQFEKETRLQDFPVLPSPTGDSDEQDMLMAINALHSDPQYVSFGHHTPSITGISPFSLYILDGMHSCAQFSVE